MESAEAIPTTTYELVKVTGKANVVYRFPRIREGSQTLVEMIVTNETPAESVSLKMKPAKSGDQVFFKGVSSEEGTLAIELNPGEVKLVTVGVDFKESPSQGVECLFDDHISGKIVAPVGEILVPVLYASEEIFKEEQAKLRGMNEVTSSFTIRPKPGEELSSSSVSRAILKVANLGTNSYPDLDSKAVSRFSGSTLKSNCHVLVQLETQQGEEGAGAGDGEGKVYKLTVNCERMMLGSLLSKHLKDALLSL
jgi:hypothetical protein